MTTKHSHVGDCPSCGAAWGYRREGDDRQYSHLIGIYDQDRDRTVEWLCPFCKARFPREEVDR